MDNNGSKGTLLSTGFLRDAKSPANHSVLPPRHWAIFSVTFQLGCCCLRSEPKRALESLLGIAIARGPGRAGGTALPRTPGIPKHVKSGQIGQPHVHRALQGILWADNSVTAPARASAALPSLLGAPSS